MILSARPPWPMGPCSSLEAPRADTHLPLICSGGLPWGLESLDPWNGLKEEQPGAPRGAVRHIGVFHATWPNRAAWTLAHPVLLGLSLTKRHIQADRTQQTLAVLSISAQWPSCRPLSYAPPHASSSLLLCLFFMFQGSSQMSSFLLRGS